MSEKRSIRLKEMAHNRKESLVPPAWYRKNCDNSLNPGPFLVRTDHNGFLLTGNGNRSDHSKLVFIGDSFVESLYVEESDRFVSLVERNLDEVGTRFDCWNGGYSGASTLQLANVILNKLYPLGGSDQTILLFSPQTDVHIYGAPATYWSESERYAPVLPPIKPEATTMVRGFEATRRILRIALQTPHVLGIRTILATSPYRAAPEGADPWLSRHLGDGYATVLTRRAMYTDAVRDVAKETNTPFIDAAAAFMERPELFYDELHLNHKGQLVFADWLTAQLLPLLGSPTSSAV